ncbi:MAG TPA: alkaline phosphatase family protein [Planctomycetota bacterium]|jgi:predicted AlkP superfamily pyrophosphatase or phosphodiesterase|nr:alkaline phosphatase family protein [Planctomycetota bacterium]OQC20451.1 MAG: Type I phosphodiesterase / nucleotide pyrophosphatase [Planctomycetes bacterium ADurb.Bin069]HNR99077.1 alkaline phosphatase family protein [Planctomycetota bacterium]HNU26230.1 alkaline phosphatase family protein [Planctomycetota bacterium]HOE30795.1 alkaline phosphatase family protein [Planctomycetota bacterium]
MRKLLVLDVVALTDRLLRHAPRLAALAREGFAGRIAPALPAVTCSAHASMLTGALPRTHGIVGNGWYFRDLAEVWLWRQSNHLVTAPKVWDRLRARRPELTVAKLFWWYNMYSTADISATPRPHYLADGRKLPGIYTRPAGLEKELESALGPFPLFNFWGPAADIRSSRWIAGAALHVLERRAPDLAFVYLPHLDYDLQRFGPDSTEALRAVAELDAEAARLIDGARAREYAVLVVADYAITGVSGAVPINRLLREHGFVAVRESLAGELLDCGASRAFAVADHQAAHVYVNDRSALGAVKDLLAGEAGIVAVLDEEGKRAHGLDHPRSGELVALSRPDRWFAYGWWLDDARAPDFARTVDIHRKPGYDPCELFFDPAKRCVRLRAALKLARRALGFRTVFDLIGLDPSVVRGSHGAPIAAGGDAPVLIGSLREAARDGIAAHEIADLIAEIMAGG